ncbi:hypothetical protein pb186bvf_019620 [Paramecium bursaria]
MGKKTQKNKEFWDTVHDIKKMTEPYLKQNKGHFIQAPGKKKQKGLKMPLPILKGMRSNIIQTIKKEKQDKLDNNIQYQSDLKTKDVNFLNKINNQKNQSQYLKNKYKFKDLKSKSIGKYQNGAIQLSQRDIKVIMIYVIQIIYKKKQTHQFQLIQLYLQSNLFSILSYIHILFAVLCCIYSKYLNNYQDIFEILLGLLFAINKNLISN